MTLFATAMLFDLDGVLADSTASVTRAWTSWAHRVGLDPAELLPKVHGRRAVDTVRAVRPELDAEAELAILEATESTDTADVVAIPGAQALTAALPAEAWAVVTSGTRRVALARLRAAGIALPRVVITAESIARGKPDPEGYLKAAGELGVAPGECVVVEDAPAGAAAARAAGMRLLALTTTHAPGALGESDIEVPDLSHVSLLVSAASNAPRPRLELRRV